VALWLSSKNHGVMQHLPSNLGKTPHAYLMELRNNLETAQGYATEYAQNAQRRYVHRYNLRSCGKSFIPGEKLLIFKKRYHFQPNFFFMDRTRGDN